MPISHPIYTPAGAHGKGQVEHGRSVTYVGIDRPETGILSEPIEVRITWNRIVSP
jgi:hypothetical protein